MRGLLITRVISGPYTTSVSMMFISLCKLRNQLTFLFLMIGLSVFMTVETGRNLFDANLTLRKRYDMLMTSISLKLTSIRPIEAVNLSYISLFYGINGAGSICLGACLFCSTSFLANLLKRLMDFFSSDDPNSYRSWEIPSACCWNYCGPYICHSH